MSSTKIDTTVPEEHGFTQLKLANLEEKEAKLYSHHDQILFPDLSTQLDTVLKWP